MEKNRIKKFNENSELNLSFSQDEVAKLIAYFTSDFLTKHNLFDKLKKTPLLHSISKHWLEEYIKEKKIKNE